MGGWSAPNVCFTVDGLLLLYEIQREWAERAYRCVSIVQIAMGRTSLREIGVDHKGKIAINTTIQQQLLIHFSSMKMINSLKELNI